MIRALKTVHELKGYTPSDSTILFYVFESEHTRPETVQDILNNAGIRII